MGVTRRSFVRALSFGGVGVLTVGRGALIAARGREALAGREWPAGARLAGTAIRLDSNENPLGPGEHVLAALREAFPEASRYPFGPEASAQAAIARAHGVPDDHVLVGCGSGEVLRMAVEACTTPARALVAASPTFEAPAEEARRIGSPVIDVPVDRELRLDLDAMAARTRSAGLVYLCNPNNPTATVHGADAVQAFVSRVTAEPGSPTVLIDEAYHEYVSDPSYRTAVPIALANPRVIVTRTFSKVFGMAGLRIGYAIGIPAALAPLRARKLDAGVNLFAAAGAIAALGNPAHIAREQARNRDVRAFTRDALMKAGFAVPASDANFIMINIRRPVQGVIDACRAEGVLIGRPFPPLTTWARVSIGTMDEMQRATTVLTAVLASAATRR